jgi:hypothetical protein
VQTCATQLRGQLDTGRARQILIEQDTVVLAGAELRQRLVCRRGLVDRGYKTALIDRPPDGQAIDEVVIDDEKA